MQKHKNKIIVIIRIILIIIFIVSLYNIVIWFLDNKKTEDLLNEISENITEEVIKVDGEEKVVLSVDFNALKSINDDTVAYISAYNNKINYPVVKASDNDYYLTRTFDKSYSDAGWIFADYQNKFDGSDKNIVLYGHARYDDSMFGSLNDFLKKDWYNQGDYTIKLTTPDGYFEYEIFSVYTVDAESYYITTNFDNTNINEYITTIKNRSVHKFDYEVTSENNILTLSTCYDNEVKRMVVHAVLVNSL